MYVKILRTVIHGHLESMPSNLATLPLKLFVHFIFNDILKNECPYQALSRNVRE